MIYPSVGQLIQLNREMVRRTGGTFGLSDRGLLESAHAAPFAGFGEYELYPGIFDKAAALARSIIQNHPFLDGNKRTGVAAALLLLIEWLHSSR
ncbi:MAG TPA: type II toxin-antitoxin system death-on-curing family toxin [Firmicutes bacterium]|nr:type II toxin-antitoxin system death-on-curing family toxin [Bacillota bacterium]